MKASEIRYERKWELRNYDVNTIVLKIYKSNFLFSELYEKRFVNSIYFDDKNFTSIHQNLDGLNDKIKYRVRWYGGKNKILNPKLEIKSKRGFINCKHVSSLKNLHDIYFNFNGIKKLTDSVNKYFNNKKILIPITSTHYERYYFISSNNLIRATLDTSISSSSLYKYCNHQFKKNFARKIFELKYARGLDDYVKNNIKNSFSRLSKSSKYIFSSVDKSNNYSI
jgi:hypothetical protein